jgi:hypothetical protein
MRNIKKFLRDFASFFILIVFEALGVLVDIIYQIIKTVQLFVKNVIYPNIINLLADLHFMCLCMLQMYYDLSSSIFLKMSQMFLQASKHCHKKSEQLLEKTWVQY